MPQRLEDLRVWGVYDTVNKTIDYLSDKQSPCRMLIKMAKAEHKNHKILLRFDLCPLYRSADKVK